MLPALKLVQWLRDDGQWPGDDGWLRDDGGRG